MLELIQVGKSIKPKGIHGALKIALDLELEEELKKAAFLFFDLDGNQVPFQIINVEQEADLLVYLKEIENPELAKQLSNKTISLAYDRLSKKSQKWIRKQSSLEGIVNYTLFDENTQLEATVIELAEFPAGLMALCLFQERQIWIPLQEEWIVEISEEDKRITMQLPDGIFAL